MNRLDSRLYVTKQIQAGWATTAPVRVFFRLTLKSVTSWLLSRLSSVSSRQRWAEKMLRQLKSALKNLFFVIKKPKVTPMKSQSKKDTNGGGSGPSSLAKSQQSH